MSRTPKVGLPGRHGDRGQGDETVPAGQHIATLRRKDGLRSRVSEKPPAGMPGASWLYLWGRMPGVSRGEVALLV